MARLLRGVRGKEASRGLSHLISDEVIPDLRERCHGFLLDDVDFLLVVSISSTFSMTFQSLGLQDLSVPSRREFGEARQPGTSSPPPLPFGH